MVLGVGIDIIEVGRIGKAIASQRFAERIFTTRERAYCESKQTQKANSYAARFAAKEAVMKALGTGLSSGSWQDVEILTEASGKPSVRLGGYFAAIAQEMGVTAIHVSLTHSKEFAAAQAVLWGD